MAVVAMAIVDDVCMCVQGGGGGCNNPWRKLNQEGEELYLGLVESNVGGEKVAGFILEEYWGEDG